MYRSNYHFALHQGQKFDRWPPVEANDPLHTNNAEILPEGLDEAFPQFNSGDMLISSRHNNMLFVLDGVTREIKWHQIGPFLRQHDPDFLSNGRILVFDNQIGAPRRFNPIGSRILEIDPKTHETFVRYQASNGEDGFYSNIRAGSQALPNGNVLISEAQGGRIFEVDRDGNMVWLYTNAMESGKAYQLGRAKRLSMDYINLEEMPSCQ